MNLMDIYNNVENPIVNDLTFQKILKAYGNIDSMYAGLVTASNRDYNNYRSFSGIYSGRFKINDRDKFYSKITNLWINNIKNMTREEVDKNINRTDFFALRDKYILKLNDVKTKEEADRVLRGEGASADIKDALNRYKWTIADKSSWEHVKSIYLSFNKKESQLIAHRLYVNPDSEDLYEFMNYFVDECEKNNMNYYFKFTKYFARDDSFVLYSSTDELKKYIDILNEIKKKHPDLVSRFKDPPILSGKINDFIGYGAEPVELNKNVVEYSFNSLREGRILKPAIKEETDKWILNNLDKEFIYNNERVTFKNIVSHMVVDDIVQSLKESIDGKSTIEAIEKTGICLYDLNSKNVLNDMYKIVDKKIRSNIISYCNNETDSIETIQLPLRNNIIYKYSGFKSERIFRKLPEKIAKNDKSFLDSLRSNINDKAEKYRIDSKKFFLDYYSVREFHLKDYEDSLDRINKKDNDLKEIFNCTNNTDKSNKK